MGDSVRSVDRCFDILEALSDGGREMSLAELSRALVVPKSTLLTIVRTLVARGILGFDEKRKAYRLGSGLARFAAPAGALALDDIARPHLEALTRATGETSTLARVEGHAVFYSCAVQGPQVIQYVVPIGVPRPLHCTASGKLALAHMDPSAVKEYIARAKLVRFTPRTITRASALAPELEAIRTQGHATSIGELSADLFGVAAPIWRGKDELVASVNLAGPIFRLGNRMPRLAQAVRQAARAISDGLSRGR